MRNLRVLRIFTAALFCLISHSFITLLLAFLLSPTTWKVCATGIYKKVLLVNTSCSNESIKQDDEYASSVSLSLSFSLAHYFLNSLSFFSLPCRYFVLDPELGQLHYFVNEQGKSQKPRGSLPLIGASVTPSDEAPHMFIVNSVNGELYKLRGMTSRRLQAVRIRQSTNTELSVCFMLESLSVQCTYCGVMNELLPSSIYECTEQLVMESSWQK